mgnify:FL=1
MRLLLISVGRRMPTWVNEGFADYAKRLRGSARLELVEVEPGKRSQKPDVEQLVREEGERLLSVAPSDHRLVALDVMGKQLSSEDLAQKLGNWIDQAQDVALLVGGADGLSAQVLEQTDECWSLSRFTLAHSLVRVVIAEQLYRAHSIVMGLPYHRNRRPTTRV